MWSMNIWIWMDKLLEIV
ncbi:hypothetical protein Zm00014a_025029 [Zea mays]|uniref:Uncharacterized protein n=1 Tax=Zea mays TaxID=4577 RepID=A0A3L6FE06_MAIZE|nr:hypothetical protein Zm00014a_025029 [Zea mays]